MSKNLILKSARANPQDFVDNLIMNQQALSHYHHVKN